MRHILPSWGNTTPNYAHHVWNSSNMLISDFRDAHSVMRRKVAANARYIATIRRWQQESEPL